MSTPHVEQLREQGYAVIRGFLPPAEVEEIRAAVAEVYAEGMKHHATFRHRNLADYTEPAYDETDWTGAGRG